MLVSVVNVALFLFLLPHLYITPPQLFLTHCAFATHRICPFLCINPLNSKLTANPFRRSRSLTNIEERADDVTRGSIRAWEEPAGRGDGLRGHPHGYV